MDTSTAPWVLARVASGTVSVMMAVPAFEFEIPAHAQQCQRMARTAIDPLGATAARIPEASSVTQDAAATGRRPIRSTSRAVKDFTGNQLAQRGLALAPSDEPNEGDSRGR